MRHSSYLPKKLLLYLNRARTRFGHNPGTLFSADNGKNDEEKKPLNTHPFRVYNLRNIKSESAKERGENRYFIRRHIELKSIRL